MAIPSGKTILSGIQPSGSLHIGNYLGAIKQWVALQDYNTAYYCIVDLHAITVPYEPNELYSAILDTAAIYLAAGLDASKSAIFVQSQIPAHAELGWLLSTQTPLGDLSRMTQFKEKTDQQKGGESLGLLAYPVLMAADILLYQADTVPVGEDQIQHIELARDMAKRFNNKFDSTFTIPKPFLDKKAARIMSFTDPTKKMSKSDPPNKKVLITDSDDDIRKKVNSAVTETEPIFSFSNSGPAVKNLLSVYQAFSDQEPEDVEKRFSGLGYKEFKEALADLLIAKIAPIRERYSALRSDVPALEKILSEGKDRAAPIANKTLEDAKTKMGLH